MIGMVSMSDEMIEYRARRLYRKLFKAREKALFEVIDKVPEAQYKYLKMVDDSPPIQIITETSDGYVSVRAEYAPRIIIGEVANHDRGEELKLVMDKLRRIFKEEYDSDEL